MDVLRLSRVTRCVIANGRKKKEEECANRVTFLGACEEGRYAVWKLRILIAGVFPSWRVPYTRATPVTLLDWYRRLRNRRVSAALWWIVQVHAVHEVLVFFTSAGKERRTRGRSNWKGPDEWVNGFGIDWIAVRSMDSLARHASVQYSIHDGCVEC